MATTIRSWRLGRELTQLRETAGLSRDEAADELDWSPRTIVRVEKGETVPSARNLTVMLELYGADEDTTGRLELLRRDARRRGWWVAFGVFDGVFVALEDDADLIRVFEPLLVPGLLQIEEYARAVTTATRSEDADAECDRHVRARLARQPLLSRTNPPAPRLHVIVDEAALRRQVGGPQVMRAQLSRLWELAGRPNITIQVVPYSAGAHAGMHGPFVLLSFADHPDIVYVESRAGDLYPESRPATSRFNSDWDSLTSAALTAEESRELLLTLARE